MPVCATRGGDRGRSKIDMTTVLCVRRAVMILTMWHAWHEACLSSRDGFISGISLGWGGRWGGLVISAGRELCDKDRD